MNISRTWCGVALCAALLSSHVQAQNLVANGDFENGMTGFTVTGGVAQVVHASSLSPFIRPIGLFDDHVLHVPLAMKQKVTIDFSVPIPSGVTYAYTSMWVGGMQQSSSNVAQVRVSALGLQYRTGGIYLPLLEASVINVSSWAGGKMPVRIELEASDYYSRDFLLDELVVEPISKTRPWIRYTGSGNFNFLYPHNLSSPNSPMLLFLSPYVTPTPLRVPGVLGQWWLDPGAMFLFATQVSSPWTGFRVPMPMTPGSFRFAAQLIELDVATNTLRLSNVIHSRTF
jgi:hypothetical protein